jgi:serine/threonine protein kinase
MQTELNPFPVIKDYVIDKRLGTGTYATVYKARFKNGSQEPYAIKCIKKASLNKTSTENLLR